MCVWALHASAIFTFLCADWVFTICQVLLLAGVCMVHVHMLARMHVYGLTHDPFTLLLGAVHDGPFSSLWAGLGFVRFFCLAAGVCMRACVYPRCVCARVCMSCLTYDGPTTSLTVA